VNIPGLNIHRKYSSDSIQEFSSKATRRHKSSNVHDVGGRAAHVLEDWQVELELDLAAQRLRRGRGCILTKVYLKRSLHIVKFTASGPAWWGLFF
jgi:hypothetical protein